MTQFLKLLIYKMNTVNGSKNSAESVRNALLLQSQSKDLDKINHNLMKITVKKYHILRIRAKISFHAFMDKNTIFEHIMK